MPHARVSDVDGEVRGLVRVEPAVAVTAVCGIDYCHCSFLKHRGPDEKLDVRHPNRVVGVTTNQRAGHCVAVRESRIDMQPEPGQAGVCRIARRNRPESLHRVGNLRVRIVRAQCRGHRVCGLLAPVLHPGRNFDRFPGVENRVAVAARTGVVDARPQIRDIALARDDLHGVDENVVVVRVDRHRHRSRRQRRHQQRNLAAGVGPAPDVDLVWFA